MPSRKIITKQLGELLIERKIITQDQLNEALLLQKQKGGLIGEVLVDMGYAKEIDIAQAITTQYGYPYLPLSNYEIGSEIISIIPERVCRQYCLMPIDKIGNTLTVSMSNPLNLQAVEDIETLTKLSVQIFVSTFSDIKNAIDKFYKK
ncbi:MAG: hypothetical protein AB1755_02870 [Candidatus Omnitrophota bacterium]